MMLNIFLLLKSYADTLSEFIFLCVQKGTTSTLTQNA